MLHSRYMTPVMYSDISGYAPKWIQEVKDWFKEEYTEIFVSLGISFFCLSYILPNGFAFASTATLGSMIGGFMIACFYVAVVAVAVYGIIKLVQYLSEQDIIYSNSTLVGGYIYEVYI